MKKAVIAILFLSVTAGLTLTNVKKDSFSSEKRIKNIEALAAGEGGIVTPCKIPGTVCMSYDENGKPIFFPGLALGE